MDTQVPGAISRGLVDRGVDVLTAQEDGMAEARDGLVLDRAQALARVLVTQDTDFFRIVDDRIAEGIPVLGVIYTPQTGISIGACIRDLELIAHAARPDEFWDRLYPLPLR